MDPHRLRLAADVELCRGSPVPLGATVQPEGVNFAVASRYATAVTLLIFIPGEQHALVEFPLDDRFHRTGEVWHAFLKGLEPRIQYAYRMDRVPNPAPYLHRFDRRQQLLDPYAKALTGGAGWGIPPRDRRPYQSLNFITCHDGFTLADLVAYHGKHHAANGEGNADGSHDTLSWNCGGEGPTDAEEINRLRRRQVRNLATILLISAGTPMILAGDEFGRTQLGNNNAYCQDNETSWVDWRLLDANADLFRFFTLLIRFRRAHPLLRSEDFDLGAEDRARHIAWHGVELGKPDWSWESRALAMHLYGMDGGEAEDIYFIANAHWEEHAFELPHLPERRWCRVVDTTQVPPHDIAEPGADEVLADQRRYVVGPRSVVVLVGSRG